MCDIDDCEICLVMWIDQLGYTCAHALLEDTVELDPVVLEVGYLRLLSNGCEFYIITKST